MAVDLAFEVLITSGVTADKKADIARKVLSALASHTLSLGHAASYSAGSTSRNAVGIEVGGTSPDYGIRVSIDSGVSDDNKANILRKLLAALAGESLKIVPNTTIYTAGNRAYNTTVTVT
jgi:hypothetical protein